MHGCYIDQFPVVKGVLLIASCLSHERKTGYQTDQSKLSYPKTILIGQFYILFYAHGTSNLKSMVLYISVWHAKMTSYVCNSTVATAYQAVHANCILHTVRPWYSQTTSHLRWACSNCALCTEIISRALSSLFNALCSSSCTWLNTPGLTIADSYMYSNRACTFIHTYINGWSHGVC